MSDISKRALGIAAILIAALILFLALHRPPPTPQQQILSEIEAARAAAQNNNASGIMQIVAPDYHDSNGLNNDQLALLLHHFARSGQPIIVALSPPGVQVQGDTATSETQATVTNPDTHQTLYSGAIDLQWKREDTTKWLILPEKQWLVVGGQYQLPGGADQLF